MSIKRLILMLALATLAASVRAETVNCTPITSVPATINQQGLYCLTGNLSTSQASGNAITINANNVTIDLNGWKVGGQAAGTGTQAIGIYSAANNVTIKNGIVRGFLYGVELEGSGAVIRDMLLDGNTNTGISTLGIGALVEHNLIVNTGGSSVYQTAAGIVITGGNSTISDNTVLGLTATGGYDAYGILIQSSRNTARNNILSNTTSPSSETSVGIAIVDIDNIIVNNTISYFKYGIDIGDISNIYSFNTVTGCTTDFSGGTAGAGNSGT
jgi:hypothetical protein